MPAGAEPRAALIGPIRDVSIRGQAAARLSHRATKRLRHHTADTRVGTNRADTAVSYRCTASLFRACADRRVIVRRLIGNVGVLRPRRCRTEIVGRNGRG